MPQRFKPRHRHHEKKILPTFEELSQVRRGLPRILYDAKFIMVLQCLFIFMKRFRLTWKSIL
jgi:hypothetical protein